MTVTSAVRRPHMYDDPNFNYSHFWRDRSYEHDAEVMAVRRLLNGRAFAHAVDIGGGYGRLSVILACYARRVTLADPSRQQLELSRLHIPENVTIERQLAEASSLPIADESADLVTLIRVLHHLNDPAAELAELSRVLRPGGYAVVEVANSVHARNRVCAMMHGHRIPQTPVDISSEKSRRAGAAPFVNHHPRAITRQFQAAGLQVRQVLSVSNLRHPLVKSVLPAWLMLAAERVAQEPLARIHFGPSLFFLLQK